MPIYEYNCRRCGETFEVRQKFSDEPIVVHEGCGGEVEKLISRSSLSFKGSGWYVNDYGRGSSKSARDSNGKKPETKGESKSESKGESKGESKSEAKSGSKPESTGESKPATKSESKTDTKPGKT